MRGAGAQWLVVLAVAAPRVGQAQLTPVSPPVPLDAPVPDTLRPAAAAPPDTTRRPPLPTPQPPDKLTRPLAIRIAAAIVVLSLTTLLLYNVRSR